MKNVIFSIFFFLSLLGSLETTGQERKPEFNLEDFRELYLLKGDWKGMAGNSAFFESFEITNDALIQIGNFSDAALARKTGNGTLYFKDGNIFHTSGNAKWRVAKKSGNSWFFEPVKGASNRFSWILKSPEGWTAVVGSKKYEMKKIK